MNEVVRVLLFAAYTLAFIQAFVRRHPARAALWLAELIATADYHPTHHPNWWIIHWRPREEMILILRGWVCLSAIQSTGKGWLRVMGFSVLVGAGIFGLQASFTTSVGALPWFAAYRLAWLLGMWFTVAAGMGARWVCHAPYGFIRSWLLILSCWTYSAVIDTHVKTGTQWKLNTNVWSLVLALLLLTVVIRNYLHERNDQKDYGKVKSQRSKPF